MCEREQREYPEGQGWDGEGLGCYNWFDDIIWILIHECML